MSLKDHLHHYLLPGALRKTLAWKNSSLSYQRGCEGVGFMAYILSCTLNKSAQSDGSALWSYWQEEILLWRENPKTSHHPFLQNLSYRDAQEKKVLFQILEGLLYCYHFRWDQFSIDDQRERFLEHLSLGYLFFQEEISFESRLLYKIFLQLILCQHQSLIMSWCPESMSNTCWLEYRHESCQIGYKMLKQKNLKKTHSDSLFLSYMQCLLKTLQPEKTVDFEKSMSYIKPSFYEESMFQIKALVT